MVPKSGGRGQSMINSIFIRKFKKKKCLLQEKVGGDKPPPNATEGPDDNVSDDKGQNAAYYIYNIFFVIIT